MGLEDILSEDEIGALLDSLDDGGMTEVCRGASWNMTSRDQIN